MSLCSAPKWKRSRLSASNHSAPTPTASSSLFFFACVFLPDARGWRVGSSGVGTDDHLGLTLLQAATGTEFIHAPYAGAGLVKNAVLAGHIDVAGLNLGEIGILGQENPPLRALAAMGEKRWELMPNVPTFREEGIDVVMTSERGLAAPRGIPDEIATRLQEAIARVMAKPEWLQRARQLELPLAYLPGAEWEAQMPAQEARYRRIWEATPWN